MEALLGEVETVFPSRGAFHLDYMLFGAASGCMGFDREAFALMLDQVCTIIYTASVDYRIVFDYCRYTVALDIVNILSEFLRITSNAFATLASRCMGFNREAFAPMLDRVFIFLEAIMLEILLCHVLTRQTLVLGFHRCFDETDLERLHTCSVSPCRCLDERCQFMLCFFRRLFGVSSGPKTQKR